MNVKKDVKQVTLGMVVALCVIYGSGVTWLSYFETGGGHINRGSAKKKPNQPTDYGLKQAR